MAFVNKMCKILEILCIAIIIFMISVQVILHYPGAVKDMNYAASLEQKAFSSGSTKKSNYIHIKIPDSNVYNIPLYVNGCLEFYIDSNKSYDINIHENDSIQIDGIYSEKPFNISINGSIFYVKNTILNLPSDYLHKILENNK